MAQMTEPLVHLTVKILPPTSVETHSDPIAFLLNLPYDVDFFNIWRIIDARYKRDYKPGGDWIFQNIQDAHGADIRLDEILGNAYGGEDRKNCVIHMLQIEAHRDITVPKGSLLRPRHGCHTPILTPDDGQKRIREGCGEIIMGDRSTESPGQLNKHMPNLQGRRRDKDGFRVPSLPQKEVTSATRIPIRSAFVGTQGPTDSTQISYEDDLVSSQANIFIPETPQQSAASMGPYSTWITTPETVPATTPTSAQPVPLASYADPSPQQRDRVDLVDFDIGLSDPIEDDESEAQRRMSGTAVDKAATPQPLRPYQALHQLTERRQSRNADPDLPTRPSDSSLRNQASAEGENGAAARPQAKWSAQDNDALTTALAKGLLARDIHQKLFPERTIGSVRKKVAKHYKSHAEDIAARKRTIHLRASSNVRSTPKVSSTAKTKRPSQKVEAKSSFQASSGTSLPTLDQSQSHGNSASKSAVFWSKEDDERFARAVRNGQDWKTLHDRHFRSRSDEAVMQHFAAMRRTVEEEDAAAYKIMRLREIDQQGEPSSRPNEKFKQYEDDLLFAARIEQVEMKRIADMHFPLRTYDDVKRRAATLIQSAKRRALKQNLRSNASEHRHASTEAAVDDLLATLDYATRERVEVKRERVRQDVSQISDARSQDYKFALKIANDKNRAQGYRDRAERNHAMHTQLETLRRREDDTASQRLAEDIQINKKYKERYAVWHRQATINEAEGKPVAPSPERPRGSGIGTEVASTQSTKAGESVVGSQPFSSRLLGSEKSSEGKRKSASSVEVRIPCAKKRKSHTGIPEVLELQPGQLPSILDDMGQARQIRSGIESGRILVTAPSDSDSDGDESSDDEDEADDVEEIHPDEVWRSPPVSDSASYDSLSSDAESIDDEMANECRRTALPDSMTAEQKERAMAGPPRAPVRTLFARVNADPADGASSAQAQTHAMSTPLKAKADSVLFSSVKAKAR